MWSVIQSSIQNMFGIEDPADVEFKYVWEENEDPFDENTTTGKVVVPNVASEYTAKAILTINDKQCVVTKNITVQ